MPHAKALVPGRKGKSKSLPTKPLAPQQPAKPSRAKTDSQDLLTELAGTVGARNAITLAGGGLNIKIRGVIPTTCFGIDEAIGRGGVPQGRLTILHGGEGGGKTTLLLLLIAQVQRMGGIAVYIDAEYKLDPEYAEALGVDLDAMIYVTPDSLEVSMDAISRCVEFARLKREEHGGLYPFLIALDSMNASVPQKVLDGDVGDHHMAPHARIYSQELPKLIKKISKEDIALIFVSQLRKNIGMQFGDDSEICGGNAPKHHASVIMYVSRIAKIKDAKAKDKKNAVIGNRCQVYVKKNQIAPPFRKAEFTIWYGKGIDSELALVEAGERLGLVQRSGAWYSFKGSKIGQGVAASADFLRKNADVARKLERKLRGEKGW